MIAPGSLRLPKIEARDYRDGSLDEGRGTGCSQFNWAVTIYNNTSAGNGRKRLFGVGKGLTVMDPEIGGVPSVGISRHKKDKEEFQGC